MPAQLAILATLAVLLVVAFLVDRLLLWIEAQGWIHYRRTRLDFTGGRQAMVRLGSFLEPAKEHVVALEERQQEERQDDDQGGRGRTRPRFDSEPDSSGGGPGTKEPGGSDGGQQE